MFPETYVTRQAQAYGKQNQCEVLMLLVEICLFILLFTFRDPEHENWEKQRF